MIRIGRDHGKFRHEVGELPVSELVKYAATYQHDDALAEKWRKKIETDGARKR